MPSTGRSRTIWGTSLASGAVTVGCAVRVGLTVGVGAIVRVGGSVCVIVGVVVVLGTIGVPVAVVALWAASVGATTAVAGFTAMGVAAGGSCPSVQPLNIKRKQYEMDTLQCFHRRRWYHLRMYGGTSMRQPAEAHYAPADPITCEIEVLPGLEPFAIEELRKRFRRRVTILPSLREGLIPILYDGDLADLLELRTVLAVYGQRHFEVPRPKALQGHAAFTTVLSMIEAVRELHPPDAFKSVRVSAAGADSVGAGALARNVGGGNGPYGCRR